jgi:hypothetical protein
MRWITKSHLHLDRVATLWLIVRFVDPNAEFDFVGWHEAPGEEDGATWFGVAGVELSSHDARGTCFRKVLDHYGLQDPALARMERVIASGVADAVGSEPPEDQTDDEAILGVAINRIGTGMAIAFDDRRHQERGCALYEALYVLCQVEMLAPDALAKTPPELPDRVSYLRQAIGRVVIAGDGEPGADGDRRTAGRDVRRHGRRWESTQRP